MEPQSALPVAPRRVRPSQRPSLPWVLRGEFPSFDGTMALCDSLCPSRRASLPSLGDTLRCACVSLPAVQDTKPRAWGSYAGPHVRTVPQGGNQGLPGSRTTHCPFALFFDPGRTEHTRPLRCDGMAPAMTTTKAPTTIHFRGSIARLQDSLFTLRPVRCHTRRKTRFRPLAKRYRTGLLTRRVVTKGF
jgi:hypothetical protein